MPIILSTRKIDFSPVLVHSARKRAVQAAAGAMLEDSLRTNIAGIKKGTRQIMKTFQGKVAVITGAASGIGRALAERCAQEGMKVVLADIEEQALLQVSRELAAQGAQTLALPTDVSQAGDVETLARKAFETYSAVHLLFNNAGVGGGKTAWESTLADWEWVLGVNLWGVIHGIHFFVPRMLEQHCEGHIVNTASPGGFISTKAMGIYRVSKHGVVAL